MQLLGQEMAQWVTMLFDQPFDLSDIPRTYTVKGENQLHGAVL